MNWNRLIRFAPVYQTRVWGGRHLESLFSRRLPEAGLPYGESWELCDRPEVQSQVIPEEGSAEGSPPPLTLHDLWTQHREVVFGKALGGHPAPRYPLLLKILDACEDLSIQVHPPTAIAASLGGEPKTEMWYVTHAQPGALLHAGFRHGVTRGGFEQALAEGTVAGLVHSLPARAGDCLFLPSGRVHAIGAGCVIFEIQQNSDTTYRVFDWNRTGLDGEPRELHLDQSLASMDFNDGEPGLQMPEADGTLVRCPFFEVRQQSGGEGHVLGQPGGHLVLALVAGQVEVAGQALKAGDFALVPAAMAAEARRVTAASADASWLEIRLPLAPQ